MKLFKCFCNNQSGVIKIRSSCLSKTIVVKLSDYTSEEDIEEIFNFIKQKLEKVN